MQRHLVAIKASNVGAQGEHLVGELLRHSRRRIPCQDEHMTAEVGQGVDHCGQLRGVDGVERRRHVAALGDASQLQGVSASALADPFGRRPELAGEIGLH
ncbi:MAG: hypothetical protein WKF64_00335 [Ilumatobacteraceae bacterium]